MPNQGFAFQKVVGPHRGDAIQAQYRPQEPFGDSVERFFASLRFEQPRCSPVTHNTIRAGWHGQVQACTGIMRVLMDYALAWKGKTG